MPTSGTIYIHTSNHTSIIHSSKYQFYTPLIKEMSLIKPQSDGIALVKKLLTVSHNKFDILYQVNLSNHLPHALYSLVSLGGKVLPST